VQRLKIKKIKVQAREQGGMEGVLEVDEEMRDDGMRDVAKRW
jgi:hypothetical protein